nr:hypothetical protein [uncultured Desulfuromonas sp.]
MTKTPKWVYLVVALAIYVTGSGDRALAIGRDFCRLRAVNTEIINIGILISPGDLDFELKILNLDLNKEKKWLGW